MQGAFVFCFIKPKEGCQNYGRLMAVLDFVQLKINNQAVKFRSKTRTVLILEQVLLIWA